MERDSGTTCAEGIHVATGCGSTAPWSRPLSSSPVFEWISQRLLAKASLNRLAARGTIRLALRKGGLDADTLTSAELALLLKELLPRELETRGVEAPEELCARFAADLRSAELAEAPRSQQTPEEVFRRVFGDAPLLEPS